MKPRDESQENQRKLPEIQRENEEILERLSVYLNEFPDFIKEDTIDEIVTSCHVDNQFAFQMVLAAALGLNVDENPHDRTLFYEYFSKMIRPLGLEDYQSNPYYKQIEFPNAYRGTCQLVTEQYAPYEVFVCDDFIKLQNGRVLPQIGYFAESFSYPAIKENNRIWMTVTPNEVETMRKPIDEAFGRVLAFGLGLGYFAYMVSLKIEVTAVTLVELNPQVIALFREYILPQFPHKEKITIVQADAFSYAKTHLEKEQFDFIFTDLWHDVSDGIPLYLRMRELEYLSPKSRYTYWIENTMRYYL